MDGDVGKLRCQLFEPPGKWRIKLDGKSRASRCGEMLRQFRRDRRQFQSSKKSFSGPGTEKLDELRDTPIARAFVRASLHRSKNVGQAVAVHAQGSVSVGGMRLAENVQQEFLNDFLSILPRRRACGCPE